MNSLRWSEQLRHWREGGQLFLQHPLGRLGLSLMIVFALMAILHPLLMAKTWNRKIYDPLVGFDYDGIPHPDPPSLKHLLGTDTLGRDVLSQLLYAAGPSFGLGLLAGAVAVTLAAIIGVTAAYFGGALDTVLMGLTDAAMMLPAPVVLLVFGLLVQMNWLQLALLYGLFSGLGGTAVVFRSQALSIKVKPYIEAARVAGGNSWHIIRAHFLPNLWPLMCLNLMFTATGAVLTEALLSFFGRTNIRLSWGTMIWFGQVTFRWSVVQQWNAILPPAFAIMLFCGAFYMVGRALDDTLNPRLRRR